jgi:hypothetical protein
MTDYITYLTPEGKAEELASWERHKAGGRGKGGQGFPDDAIFPLCAELNAMPGICTLQSCAGHPATEREHVYSGQLWLWLDRPTFWWFVQNAPQLTRCRPLIEYVEILFGRDGNRAIVNLMFAGDEQGLLSESSAIILEFFKARVVKQHRWSGWPGAYCLDCGADDPIEAALGCHDCKVPTYPGEFDDVITLCPEHASWVRSCSTPEERAP